LQPHGDISALGIFASLPALLFTFDSFLMIGNAANSMNQPQKTIPRALLIGIPTIAGIYLLVTIGQLFVGQPDVYSFFSYVVRHFGGGNDAVTAINVVIGCTIMVSLFGSVNAMTLSAVHSIQSAIDDEIIVGSKLFKKLTNGRRLYAGALFGYIIGTFITCLIAIPIIVMNSDAAYDGVSNLPTLFFFIIYGTVILFGLINHYTGKVEVHRMKMFPIIAVISILGCYFAFCYNLFYEFTARNFVNDAPVNWGMFKHATIDR
jgi:amino acid transporter